jgi:cytochrome P450
MSAGQLPPGPPRLASLIGSFYFVFDPLGGIRSLAGRHGPVVSVRSPGFGLMIYVTEPELVKQVFTGDSSVFHAGEAGVLVIGPVVGANSVLTLDDEPHIRQRKLLLPPFHGENVSRWAETIRQVAARDMEESPWAPFERARAEMDAFLYEEIALRRNERDLAERDDVLPLLLRATDEDGRSMSDQELRDELVTVIGAGHETTATGLAWAFERLLRNPSVLDNLRRSLAEGDEYLDATIKETLRVRPVILDLARRLTREIELSGYRIPAGALLLPSIAAIHSREDLYPQPDEFRPERFLDQQPGSYSWIPFGGGVRRCIGASFAQFEMRVIIRAIVERAELRAAKPAAERPRLRNITIAPARGCMVVLDRPLRPRHERELAAGVAS